MLRQLADPAHEAHADFARKTRQVVRLPTDQLAGALNEHVRWVGGSLPAAARRLLRLLPLLPRLLWLRLRRMLACLPLA